jgi:phage shock protein A
MDLKPGQASPSPEVQALMERIAFLEEQITELRRASMAEKARLSARRASRQTTLRRIRGSLASALVFLGVERMARKIVHNEHVYKLVKMRPLMRPIEDLLRCLRTKP